MDIEYHFYITYIVALRAGADSNTAYKIAYSSQYTDDNNTVYEMNRGKKGNYSNYISQSFNILKPKDALIRIHSFFHYFPGTEQEILKASLRRDGKLHFINTTPGNKNAQKLLSKALRSGNPYKIGIATHTFADTYAHQNFVGLKEKFNAMNRFEQKLNLLDIGHSDALDFPDLPGLLWDDNRLIKEHRTVNNRERFLAATGHIFQLYCKHLTKRWSSKKLKSEADKLMKDISSAIGKVNKKDGDRRQKRIQRYVKIIGDKFVHDYDSRAWFREAVQIRYVKTGHMRGTLVPVTRRRFFWKDEHKSSDWYQFQEAVKEHQDTAQKILKPLFSKTEITTVQNW